MLMRDIRKVVLLNVSNRNPCDNKAKDRRLLCLIKHLRW